MRIQFRIVSAFGNLFGFLVRQKPAQHRQSRGILSDASVGFPPIALGYLLLLVLGTQSPLGGFFSDVFGIKLIFSQTGIVLAAFIAGLPLFIRPVQSALKSVNLKEIEDAKNIPIIFDEDCEELSPPMIKAFKSAVVQRNRKKKA